MKTELEIVHTNLKRQTFQSKKTKKWVEENSYGLCLNLFAGTTKLNLNEVRNDIDKGAKADYRMDALDFVRYAKKKKMKFDTIILDPPYSYRKAMEMYHGHYTSRFKQIADLIPDILTKEGRVISFGYHSTFLGKTRRAVLKKLCVFAHGGAQHCTIGIIEEIK